VHRSREELFTRARLSEQNDRCICGRHFLTSRDGSAQPRAVPDDVFEIRNVSKIVESAHGRRKAARQLNLLLFYLAQVVGAFDRQHQQIGQ
jgi:hypothetical protein